MQLSRVLLIAILIGQITSGFVPSPSLAFDNNATKNFNLTAQGTQVLNYSAEQLMRMSQDQYQKVHDQILAPQGICTKGSLDSATIDHCARLTAFFRTKDVWDKCLPGFKNSPQALGAYENLLGSFFHGGKNLFNSQCSCAVTALKKLQSDTLKITSEAAAEATEKGVLDIAMRNTANALYKLAHTLPSNRDTDVNSLLKVALPHDSKTGFANYRRVVENDCKPGLGDSWIVDNGNNQEKCKKLGSYKFRTLLENLAQQPDVKALQVARPEEVRATINKGIKSLNNALLEMRVPVQPDHSIDDAKNSDQAQVGYARYNQTYASVVSDPQALLLKTDVLASRVGDKRVMDKGFLQKMGSYLTQGHGQDYNLSADRKFYEASPHNILGPQDDALIKKAGDELQDNLAAQAEMVINKWDAAQDRTLIFGGSKLPSIESSLGDLALINPLAVGTYLMKDIGSAALFCDVFKKIKNNETNRKLLKQGLFWTGVVLLAASGVGTVAALGIGAGGAILGSAAAVGTAEAITTVSGAASLIASGAKITNMLVDADQYNSVNKAQSDAFLAGNNTAQAVIDQKEAYAEVMKQADVLAKDLALDALAGGAALSAKKIISTYAKTEKGALRMKELSNTLQGFTLNKSSQGLKKLNQLLGGNSKDGSLIIQKFSQKTRAWVEKALKKIEDGTIKQEDIAQELKYLRACAKAE